MPNASIRPNRTFAKQGVKCNSGNVRSLGAASVVLSTDRVIPKCRQKVNTEIKQPVEWIDGQE